MTMTGKLKKEVILSHKLSSVIMPNPTDFLGRRGVASQHLIPKARIPLEKYRFEIKDE